MTGDGGVSPKHRDAGRQLAAHAPEHTQTNTKSRFVSVFRFLDGSIGFWVGALLVAVAATENDKIDPRIQRA